MTRKWLAVFMLIFLAPAVVFVLSGCGGGGEGGTGGGSMMPVGGEPVYDWTKKFGGEFSDHGRAVATDSSGNIYIAGSFTGYVKFAADFGGEEPKISSGNTDIFVTKISANGTHEWTKRIGGAGNDGASGIAVDAHDNVYVAGYFEKTVDFRADFGGEETKISYGDTTDIFVTRIDASGTYGWTKRIGGEDNDKASGIAVDADDNVYIAGSFRGEFDFADDFAGEPDQGASHGDEDIFITMLTADGDYGWSRRMGGAGADAACAVAVDSSGGIYVTGYFEQTVDFRADFGGNNTKTSAGKQDIFITKVSPDGTYAWSRRMGGVYDDYGLGITVNQADVVYMTGFFTGSVNFGSDFGKSDFKRSTGQTDVFLTKITP